MLKYVVAVAAVVVVVVVMLLLLCLSSMLLLLPDVLILVVCCCCWWSGIFFTVVCVHLHRHFRAAAPHAGHDCQRRHGNICSNLQYPAASALRRRRQSADDAGACKMRCFALLVMCVDCGFLSDCWWYCRCCCSCCVCFGLGVLFP